MPDPKIYYNPETCLFPQLSRRWATGGTFTAEEFYLILDWKAPRARRRHRDRLVKIAGSFDAAVRMIACQLRRAPSPEQKLQALIIKWGFRLPTASAILSVLAPDTFTVYDIRVCERLSNFQKLGNMQWSSAAWQEYEQFAAAVRAAAPQGLSLRDCDRWLWGLSKRDTLRAELAQMTPT